MKESVTNVAERRETGKKPSAIIDLDILTVAHWKGMQKPEADKLLARVTAKEFYIATPFILVELLISWRDRNLVQRIEDFYSENTDMWLSDGMVKEQAEAIGVNLENLIKELERSGVKQEDSVLVAISAIFKIDYLITFNRKHLSGKKDVINEVLKRAGLQPIRIINPQDLGKTTRDAAEGSDERNYSRSLSLFKNFSDIPSFISSANSTGSTLSGIIAFAFHFLSFTRTSMSLLLPITLYKHFHLWLEGSVSSGKEVFVDY